MAGKIEQQSLVLEGWVGGWMDWWLEVKTVLRIACSSKKANISKLAGQ